MSYYDVCGIGEQVSYMRSTVEAPLWSRQRIFFGGTVLNLFFESVAAEQRSP
jgi:hypothetical protein